MSEEKSGEGKPTAGARLVVFLSGRMVSLVLLLLFQILIVRILVPEQYDIYAVAFALASLANTIGLLGSTHILPRYVGPARTQGRSRFALAFSGSFLAARCLVVLAISIVGFSIASASLTNQITLRPEFLVPFIFISIASAIYSDADVIAQALGLQRLSRSVAISEASLRCLGLLAMVLLGRRVSGQDLVYLTATTQIVAAGWLVATSLGGLRARGAAEKDSYPPPPIGEIVGLASAAYFSGLTYALTAPSVVRLVAASCLPSTTVAALSFMQSITGSLQRYSPGFILFPLVEPMIMGYHGKQDLNKDSTIASILSLLGKIDVITFGAIASVTIPAGMFVLGLVVNKSLAVEGELIPIMVMTIAGMTVYRCVEVAGAFSNRLGGMYIGAIVSPISFAILTMVSPHFGIWGILAIPLLDVIVRVACADMVMQRHGIAGVVDWRLVGGVGIYLAAIGVIIVGLKIDQSSWTGAVLGVTLALGFLVAVALLKPLTRGEGDAIVAVLRAPIVRTVISPFIRA